jgi:hypothetical protein
VPPNTGYNTSASGWMEEKTFDDWFTSFFLKLIPARRPVVLIFDNHGSNVTLKLIHKAVENNIHVICIPPHTSHVFQQLDVAALGPMKASCRKKVKSFYESNNCNNINKQNISSLINSLHQTILMRLIRLNQGKSLHFFL